MAEDSKDIRENIKISLKKVEEWVENQNYKGYEPFDGLSSFFRPLTFGNLFLDRLLMQANRQSPINLRPVLGIKPLDSTIGRGYMAWGYLIMFKITGEASYAERARKCLDWLMQNKSPQFDEYSWGKHFDFASRGGRYPKFEPITIWTALICQAFLAAYEVLDEIKYLEVADSVCRWILALPKRENNDGIYINYTASQLETTTIHNHNMYAAAVLARTAKWVKNQEYQKVAEQVMAFSCAKQQEDGSWYYGEDEKFHWIDNFHTGYNLDALKYYTEYSGDESYRKHLLSGFDFYKNNFFEESGRPKYYHNSTFPVDSQCAAQAIDTLAYFSEFDDQAMDLAIKVSDWWIKNMQDNRGYFYYRQYPIGIKAKTPMLHWAQATSYKSLAMILLCMK